MSDQIEKKPIQFYTVCFPEYDSWTIFHGRLFQVRRDFFQSRIASQETITDFSEGIPAKYSHSISRWGMRWKKKLDGQLREYSSFDSSGSAILFQDTEARTYGKIVFGKDLNWVCSYYYEKGKDSSQVRFELTGDPVENTITLTEYVQGEEPVKTQMLARPFFPGTVEQSLLNSKLGEPRICAATDQGDFCYYRADLAERYDQLTTRLHEGKEPLGPAWKTDRNLPASLEPDWYQEQERTAPASPSDLPPLEQLGSLRTQLFQDGAEEDDDTLPETFSLEDADAEQDDWVEEMLHEDHSEQNRLSFGEDEDDFAAVGRQQQKNARYAASREVFHVEVPQVEVPQVEVPKEEPVAEDVKEVMGMIDQMETEVKKETTVLFPETESPKIQDVVSKGMFPEGAMPTRYTVAGKKRNSSAVRASDLFRKADAAEEPKESGEAPAVSQIGSKKRIVISALESRDYVGKVVRGLRGDASDEPLANLEFAGKIQNGERQGAGLAYSAEDGTVFVGRWKNNIPTGEGSAFDGDGNLIYTGSWKEGKRHGQGTEYAPDGRIIFQGEWKDDTYGEGVFHQRMETPGKKG